MRKIELTVQEISKGVTYRGIYILLLEEKDAILEKYGVVRCSETDLRRIPSESVVGVRRSPYGVEAAVKRSAVPAEITVGRLGIEELFVFMAKEEN